MKVLPRYRSIPLDLFVLNEKDSFLTEEMNGFPKRDKYARKAKCSKIMTLCSKVEQIFTSPSSFSSIRPSSSVHVQNCI